MKIIIDGLPIEVEGKKTVLETARESGIPIPSLCDHPRLSPFGGCRLCLVEIKGKKGFLPACTTPVEDKMEVRTDTLALQTLRKQILSLILSEHPNACLICSEKEKCDEHKATIRKVGEVTGCVLCSNNGRCELQDVAEALKIDMVEFPSLYRNFDVHKEDPFFDRNYNLCILCGRCVRVCHEVRGASAVSFIFRGSLAVVGTAFDRPLLESGCQFCGACLDVCPTGSLVERSARPQGLPDETRETICPLCSLGCRVRIELKNGKILNHRPSTDGVVNEGQACLKGRFLIRDVVHSPRRILKPMIKINGRREESGWDEALDYVAENLSQYQKDEAALVASAHLPLEDLFVLQKFAGEAMNTENIIGAVPGSPLAARLDMAREFGLPPGLNFDIHRLSQARTFFLVGADPAVQHPIVWLQLFQAVRNGAKLVIAGSEEVAGSRHAFLKLRIRPGTELELFGSLAKVILERGQAENEAGFENLEPFKKAVDGLSLPGAVEATGIGEENLRKTARLLLDNKPVCFLFGSRLARGPRGRWNVHGLWNLALLAEARLIALGLEANERGLLEMGCLQGSMDFESIARKLREGTLKALYLAGPFPGLNLSSLEFLVVQDSHMNDHIERAHAVFPAATFAETEGTFVNGEGRIQTFSRAIEPLGEARPDWWIFSRLAQRMGIKGFTYKNSSEILEEMSKDQGPLAGISFRTLKKGKDIFVKEEQTGKNGFLPLEFGPCPIQTDEEFPLVLLTDHNSDCYRSLVLSAESRGLKRIRDSRWIRINPGDAGFLGLKEKEKIEVESASWKIRGVTMVSPSVMRGTVEATVSSDTILEASPGSSSGSHSGGYSRGIFPVRIARVEK